MDVKYKSSSVIRSFENHRIMVEIISLS